MFIVVGLGNPGDKYAYTRHNAGFMALACMAEELGVKVNKVKFSGQYRKTKYEGQHIVLLEPHTYMNLSGKSVAEALAYYGCSLKDLIVLVDDIDLPLGRIRVKQKGSAGSHNGLKSIIQALGSNEFARVRIGISKQPEQMDLADYVLSRFSKEELPVMERAAEQAAQAALTIVAHGVDEAMQRYNGVLPGKTE
ncbi:aminoacyl-tRNA hydrolase [Clostridia bacterium OttesenSCG-928-F22]|nr:aminoacyl-tRNA hydrolase [Clostridia bacterium OttesenSCG-928-F22]